MMFQSSSRQDGHSLLTSFVYTRAIRRLKKQVAALTREKEELQQLIEESKKREQHKDQRLDKLQQLMEALQRQLDESKAQMLQAAKESKERDYQMLEAQRESKLLIESIQRYTKSGVYALIGTELIGDLIIDLYKEVVKRAIGQDTWEAWGNLIRSWIGPWLSAILEAIASNFPMLLLIIKAAITIMVIAAPILNLTVLVWPTLRAGLGKLRSKRASKK